jgi:hypothetical protein
MRDPWQPHSSSKSVLAQILPTTTEFVGPVGQRTVTAEESTHNSSNLFTSYMNLADILA